MYFIIAKTLLNPLAFLFELCGLRRIILLQMAKVMNADSIVMDLNMMLQGLVSTIPTTYPGASATFFDFGAALTTVGYLAPKAAVFSKCTSLLSGFCRFH